MRMIFRQQIIKKYLEVKNFDLKIDGGVYATKRYRSNLINWGMLPFLTEEDHEALSFKNGDYIFVPEIRKAVEDKNSEIKAYVVDGENLKEIQLKLGDMTDTEREIILKGCLINYYRG